MPLKQLVYASRPFGFDDLALRGILALARRNNERDGITGALVCREDLYLQLLEGRHDRVEAALKRIAVDDRHTDLKVLISGDVTERLFPGWAMRHDPARSWMWSRAEIAAGSLDRCSRASVLDVFHRIAAEPAEADSAADDPNEKAGCPHSD
ncbi:MAG: blue light sensor protein [Hyphomicrobium sp.]|nr:MAG: blue light sensor protein [Hyphomicrobium sp.]